MTLLRVAVIVVLAAVVVGVSLSGCGGGPSEPMPPDEMHVVADSVSV